MSHPMPRPERSPGGASSLSFAGRAVAVFATRWGGPDVLRVAERQIGPPNADQIVIEVVAAGVAFGDLLIISPSSKEV